MVIEIRAIDNLRNARKCVEIQRSVWGFSERDLVTPEMLLTSAHQGGILLGAYPHDADPVGFVFSFPAPLGRREIQHSHMLAVLPEFQDRGIGNQLKWAQFEEARRQGCPLITWTYDPLEARNAYLNLNKLGAYASRYYSNLYGDQTSSRLHQGIGTDRLLAEWPVNSPQPAPLGGKVTLERAMRLPQVITAAFRSDGLLVPSPPALDLADIRLALEIPRSIQQVKRVDMSLAQQWRECTRRAFLRYLNRGYQVRGLMVANDEETLQRRVFYCLQRENSSNLGPGAAGDAR